MTRTLSAIAAVLLAASTAGAFAATPPAHPATAPAPKTQASLPGSHKGAMMSARRIEEIQVGLQRQGAKIPADGIWGPKTVAALRTFQKKNGLAPTGRFNQATAERLTLPHWS
jgi:peptidoglycan hydrolase-like protein with peptidoglycan-binding domain